MSKYDSLIKLVEEKIKSGEWPPGTWLPSQAEWLKDYGVKYGSLRGAYLVLKARGMIIGRQGDGVFVAGAEPTTPAPMGGRGTRKKEKVDTGLPMPHSVTFNGKTSYAKGHGPNDGCESLGV